METGTKGRLGDYDNGDDEKPGAEKGSAATDRCSEEIHYVRLQEVANCDYFLTNGSVPSQGSTVALRDSLVGSRLAIATVDEDLVVGFLPTTCNYLRVCVEQGYRYAGEVIESEVTPNPRVSIKLSPTK